MDNGCLKSHEAGARTRERQALANAMYVARAADSLPTRPPRSDSGITYLPSYAGDELGESRCPDQSGRRGRIGSFAVSVWTRRS